jgi:hypothetical protein
MRLLLEENIFARSAHWQKLRSGNRNYRNPHENVELVRQEILEYFESSHLDRKSRSAILQSKPMSMRAGGPQKYIDNEFEALNP